MIDELEQMRNCDGKKIVDKIRHLFFITKMMIENFDDFKKACAYVMQDKAQAIFHENNEYEKEQRYCRFARPFYNCLELYYAVTQHFDVIKNQNKNNAKFVAEYNKNWKGKDLSSDETKFINGMRSYIVHYQIPILTIRTAMFPCGMNIQLLISKSSLLKYKDWTAQARNYIENYYIKTESIKTPLCNDCEYAKENSVKVARCRGLYKECTDIEIAPIVERCINNVIHFYNWIISYLESEHKDKIAEYDGFIKQWNDFVIKEYPNKTLK